MLTLVNGTGMLFFNYPRVLKVSFRVCSLKGHGAAWPSSMKLFSSLLEMLPTLRKYQDWKLFRSHIGRIFIFKTKCIILHDFFHVATQQAQFKFIPKFTRGLTPCLEIKTPSQIMARLLPPVGKQIFHLNFIVLLRERMRKRRNDRENVS